MLFIKTELLFQDDNGTYGKYCFFKNTENMFLRLKDKQKLI